MNSQINPPEVASPAAAEAAGPAAVGQGRAWLRLFDLSTRQQNLLYWLLAALIFGSTILGLYIESLPLSPAEQSFEFDSELLAIKDEVEAGNTSEARRRLIAFQEDHPSNALGYAYLARIDVEAGLYVRSIENYSKAIGLQPNEIQFRHARALIYRQLGWYEKARLDMTAVLNKNPNDIKALLERSSDAGFVGRPEESLADLDLAELLDPENINVYFIRAQIYEALGRIPETIKDLQKQLEIGSADIQQSARIKLRQLQAKASGPASSAQPASPAGGSAPPASPPETGAEYESRAKAYLQAGKLDEAIAAYSQAISLQPGALHYLFARSQIYRNKVQWAQAAEDMTAVLVRKPDEYGALILRSTDSAAQGRIEASFADLARAVQIEPTNPEAYYIRAQIYVGLNKATEANKDLDKILELGIDLYELYVPQLRQKLKEQAAARLP